MDERAEVAARSFDSVNPADGSLVGTFPVCSEADVRRTVERAVIAADWWRDQGFSARGSRLAAWRRYVWSHVDEVVDLIHRENGKTRDDALMEVVLTVEHMRWAERNAQKVLKSRSVFPGILFANFSAAVDYVPYGVVGIISPWNYPLYSPNSSVAYALAAGNAVVLKPSEFTPAVGTWYVDAFRQANPDAVAGVLQVVTGPAETGGALCSAGVGKIGFTGSSRTGKRIMAQCAETLTPVILECGGKDPAIVAADADLAAAAQAIAWGGYTNAGQTCVGVERVYVVQEVRDEFLRLLADELQGVTAGVDVGATYGPMTMPAQVEVVRRHVSEALAAGATAMVGGADSVGDRFIEPVLLVDAPEDVSAVREETFGPTLTVRTVADIDEAVRLANDHDYRLSASVFSAREADQIADRLNVGQVALNNVIAFAGMGGLPMGGVGASGFGRVHGDEGLREFAYARSRVRKKAGLPGFEAITLHRKKHVMPLMKRMLTARNH